MSEKASGTVSGELRGNIGTAVNSMDAAQLVIAVFAEGVSRGTWVVGDDALP